MRKKESRNSEVREDTSLLQEVEKRSGHTISPGGGNYE